ncbi:hypothetical protein [Enterococcus durans]|nr:hypothetical protein [Enterococcus durans]
MHHYITKYQDENEKLRIVSWLQINLFNKSYCFSKKELAVPKDN